ncbi:hypothetical protein LR48_Vigan03g095100 [Vigna angularis]|uniref:Transposase (putative) gypsy type domain-containing protein n=1 Tax=Phaseolus angularis TaxID=3914 RepID=A0A0L9U584_PHAAN|nr:hypothetical protein LR48_Vigan03g095100 [Vigna angularis]
MSSSLSVNEVVGEGLGYADEAAQSSSSVSSSILGSENKGSEGDVELEVDNTRECASIEFLAGRVCLLSNIRDAERIKLVVCVRLPFFDFQMGVLRALNVCPIQLHPNGWAYMQAFSVVCSVLLLTPTLAAFLHFFRAIPIASKSWVSLAPVKDKQLFTLFNASYKDFKTNFFKVAMKDSHWSGFYTKDGRPKFPFYWTSCPKKVISWSKAEMSLDELDVVSQFDQLPQKIFSHKLIGFLGSNTLRARVFDLYGGMEKHRAFLAMMVRKKEELKKTGEGTSSPNVVGLKNPTPRSVHSAPKVSADQPFNVPLTIPEEVHPESSAKRKMSREKSVSSNKKSKKKTLEGPLCTGPLDPSLSIVERLQYNLQPDEKKPFREMSPSEALDMAYELTGAAKSLMVEELETARQDLEAAQKENINLLLRLIETLKIAEDDCTKATTSLTQAKNTNRQLKRENDTLKLDLQKASTQNDELMKERDSLIVDQKKLAAKNEYLARAMCDERLHGFDQGIAQCHYFFETPLNHPGFDIMKVLVDGQLVTLALPDDNVTQPAINPSIAKETLVFEPAGDEDVTLDT